MYRTLLLAVLILMLSACSTTYAARCEPPSYTLVQAVPLPLLELDQVSLKHLLESWMEDMGAFNALAARHNTLATWVHERC